MSAETEMYGCTETDILNGLASAKRMGYTSATYVDSILSDVQEAMSHGELELARQFCNKAKLILFSVIDTEVRHATTVDAKAMGFVDNDDVITVVVPGMGPYEISGEVYNEILQADKTRKAAAIKYCCRETGLRLKEAMDLVEHLWSHYKEIKR